MVTKFTKGNWKYSNNDGCKDIYVETDGFKKQGVCTAFTHGIIDDDEDLANAKLIAAAPEMFEALLKITKAIKRCSLMIDTQSLSEKQLEALSLLNEPCLNADVILKKATE